MLNDEERALAAALRTTAEALPADAHSTAAQEVADLLRRLGYGNSAAAGEDRPAAGATRTAPRR
jgi:hypothetical protein